MDYSLFEKIIMKQACCFVIIGAILLIASLFAIYYIFKKMRCDKPMLYTLLSLCVIVIVGDCILCGNVVYSSLYDIKNQAYIVYDGVFSIGKYVEDDWNCSLILNDEKKTKLEIDAYILESGEYTGKVVYGEKTKIVFDIERQGDG